MSARSWRVLWAGQWAIVLLAVAPLGVALVPSRACAQAPDEGDDEQGPLPSPDWRSGEGRRGPSGKEANRITIPHSRELEVQLQKADKAVTAGRLDDAVRGYVALLAADRDPKDGAVSLAPVTAGSEGRYTSYSRLVRERLYALPDAARKAARALVDEEAAALFARARSEGDARTLEIIWRTYPLASCAGPALELRADMALEGGDLAVAIDRYDRAIHLVDGGLDPRRLEGKLLAAKALFARVTAAPTHAPRSWPVVGGDNAHAAALPDLPAIADKPRLWKPLPVTEQYAAWGTHAARVQRGYGSFLGGSDRQGDPFPEMIPTSEGDRGVFVCSRYAICYDLETGNKLWYANPWQGKDDDKPVDLFASGTIAGGRVFASFVDRISREELYRGIPIVANIPHRRLVAFDLAGGRRLWDQAESEDPFMRAASIALPPIERAGTLYAGAVIREGAIKTYLLAIDAATGKLRWKRFVGAGQIELTMFGEQAVEPLSMMPAERAGVVFWCNACGTMSAIDALTGEVEWLTTYDTIALEAAQTYYAHERELVWKNAPPIVTDGVVFAAPIDSDKAFGFDEQNGDLRWALDHGSDRRVLGARAGAILLMGDHIRAIDARSGKLVRMFPRDPSSGIPDGDVATGVLCGRQALVPMPSGILRVDMDRGERAGDLAMPGGIATTGALLWVGRSLITVNPQRVSVFEVSEPVRIEEK